MSALYLYEPFFSLNDFYRLFDDASRRPERRGGDNAPHENTAVRSWSPRMNIVEYPQDTITVTIELPGLKKDQVNIGVQNNRLTISGEVNDPEDLKEDAYVLRERRSGKFSRSLPLPADLPLNLVKATMEDGILKLTFPKSSPEKAPKKIDIA